MTLARIGAGNRAARRHKVELDAAKIRKRLLSDMRNSRLSMPHVLFPEAMKLSDEELGKIFKWQMKYIVSHKNVDEVPELSKKGEIVYKLLRRGVEMMITTPITGIPKLFESLILPHIEHLDAQQAMRYIKSKQGKFEFPVKLQTLLNPDEYDL